MQVGTNDSATCEALDIPQECQPLLAEMRRRIEGYAAEGKTSLLEDSAAAACPLLPDPCALPGFKSTDVHVSPTVVLLVQVSTPTATCNLRR